MPRNPAWTSDELILALDVYINKPGARIDKGDPALAELSSLLISLPLHPNRPDATRFRNVNSVYLKLQNFKAVDASYSGTGMRAGAGVREHQVWQRFADRPFELASEAAAIRVAARQLGTADFSRDDVEEVDGGVIEGAVGDHEI